MGGRHHNFLVIAPIIMKFGTGNLPREGGGGGNLHMSRYGDVPLFWVLFGGCSQIFGYLFGLFPDFWVSFFWLFPDFWVSFFGKI